MSKHPVLHRMTASNRTRESGFSLVELMVALALGLVLMAVMASMYLTSNTASRRQVQLSSIQQNVRAAFEFLTADARAAGLSGCVAANDNSRVTNLLSAADTRTNLLIGVEGYDAATEPTYPRANVTAASSWTNNTGAGTAEGTLPLATLGGTLAEGSDVLILRNASSGPIRLTANTTTNTASLSIESVSSSGTCSDGTAKLSGFCAGTYGLISSCSDARVFSVANVAGSNLTLSSAIGAPIYGTTNSEVFPLQTIGYYVKVPSADSAPSLYRRVMNGDVNEEQELIENVEAMQVLYGVDTTAPDPDGIVDAYVTANQVVDWSRVVAIRVGLLLRDPTPLPGDTLPAASAEVNGVPVTFPTTGRKFDRRVFNTTIAIRNKV